jgi:uncharacterized protein
MAEQDGFGDRELKFSTGGRARVDPDGRFKGYASLFGVVDLGRDRIERGAFARSLAERGPGGIRMLYQHDAGAPVGHWEHVGEDGRGLVAHGRLALGSARGREVHALMRAGALDGLSIGFRTVRAKRDAATGIRRILEADLWEISIVTFPMLPGARVAPLGAIGDEAGEEARLAAAIRSAARTIEAKERCI